MIKSGNLEFSFSGLKTAVMKEIGILKANKSRQSRDPRCCNPSRQSANREQHRDNEAIIHLSYEIQESITDVLVEKTLTAAVMYNVKSIILGGGVAANKRLREKMKLKIENCKLKIDLHIPPPSLCTDNAAYIASYAYFNCNPVPWQNIQARPDLKIEV